MVALFESSRRDQPPAFTRELPALELLRVMIASREADRREGILMRQGQGWFQIPGSGHEALAAIAYQLGPEDYIVPHYRDRALMLARGVTPRELALDFLAREGSSSGGRNLPSHHSARHLRVFSIASPVGSQCLPATGIAWGIKKASGSEAVVCLIGDGSCRQGEFFEAICFAVQESLPIVFVVEDNGYSISTSTRTMLPLRLGVLREALVTRVDGRDASQVFEQTGRALAAARRGEGPSILWCDLDRLASHTSADDQRLYRDAEELAREATRDPIRALADKLITEGVVSAAQVDAMEREAAREIAALYDEILLQPMPDPAGVFDHLYGQKVEHTPVPFQPEEPETTMVAAINRTLRAALETKPSVCLFGQDIEDPKGGVFGFTKGLSNRFPGRVVNAPVAEASIVGLPVGLAATGWKPVFEIQFIDFMAPGFNQLVSQVATLRWRSVGRWSCPMVLYAPYGAYLPAGGMWHSQSNDAFWAHTPGLRVAVPSTPEDAVGLFWAAIEDDDPSLILISKHLLRMRVPVRSYAPVAFGKAAIRREGSDVTVVTWGSCVDLVERVAAELAADGVSVEVIDPRTLVPCDWDAIEASLAKTGRLVVVHEDNRTCGFGQAIIAEMTTTSRRFHHLLSPPELVARADVHVPFRPELELAILPSSASIHEAIRRTLE